MPVAVVSSVAFPPQVAQTGTFTSNDVRNTSCSGLKVVLDMTSAGAGSVTLTIQGKDERSGKGNRRSGRLAGPQEAAALRRAGRGRGGVDPARTGTSPRTVQRVRSAFSGPGTSGYNFRSQVLGSNLAAHVPGTTPPLGHRS